MHLPSRYQMKKKTKKKKQRKKRGNERTSVANEPDVSGAAGCVATRTVSSRAV